MTSTHPSAQAVQTRMYWTAYALIITEPPTPIQQVGNVTVPEARMIVIQPWEKSLLKEIEKQILVSDLGINPTNDGNVIRLVFPELTEERRKDLAKDVKKKR